MNNKTGVIALLVTAIFWGLGFIAQFLGSSAVNPFNFVFIRCVIGVITILVIIIINNIKKYKQFKFFDEKDDIKELLRISFITGIILAFAMETQQIGIPYTSIAKAGFIASLNLIFVPIILFIIYKNKIYNLTKLFILLSVVGFFLLNFGKEKVFYINIGDLWCLLSTIFFSIDVIILGKNAHKFDGLKLSLFRFVTVMIVSFIFSVTFERKIQISEFLSNPLPLLYSGIVVTGIAYSLQIIGEQKTDTVLATMIMSLEGVFASIFGYIILGQTLNFYQIIGCLLILFSTIMVQLVNNYD